MLRHIPLTLVLIVASHLAALAQPTDWRHTDYDGEPWVRDVSRPNRITHGLEGRHLSLWASHGHYYDQSKQQWRWQRPALFCTTEDLFTQTIVVPYLIPMLENAGAIVFTPRERDWQRHEVIVDNDQLTPIGSYQEQGYRKQWQTAPGKGFAMHDGHYQDGENPFAAGTARMIEATRSKSKLSTVTYQPNIPEAGRYAVYVSYQTVDKSVSDAHYTVWHQGQKTDFLVNQCMGGSTWVYLGTFDFDQGSSRNNRVVLTNQSGDHGVVTADAVRFGGGMGNIERGGRVSQMPRCLEGARYYAQWAGMPYNIYSPRHGNNDYADDINVRSLMTNLLCGGSVFAPDSTGRKVPIELSLAVHSDAGYTPTGEGVYGTLAICTTQHGDSLLAAGNSRTMSKELATELLDNTQKDLANRFGQWTKRSLYDRNYSETRMPIVPSAILETMSHQNFGDMRYGQDPNFRFELARSVYKTLLRYVCRKHNQSAVVTPLTPIGLRAEFSDQKHGELQLSWTPVGDPQEPTALPTEYIVYTALNNDGFDNGTIVSGTSCEVKLMSGVLYSFRVCAMNKGGKSFPTPVVSALYRRDATQTVLVVDGFHRLSSPAISGQGFRLDIDPGVTLGRTAGWLGQQRNFDTRRIGIEDSTGLGYSSDDLAGHFIAGNDQNYVRTHAEAIQSAMKYNVVSCASEALGRMALYQYALIDLALGLECDDGHSLIPYKAITAEMQQLLRQYAHQGGRLLVSGAYVGTDMRTAEEQQFLTNVLKCQHAGCMQQGDEHIDGLGQRFSFYHYLNEQHYAATKADILAPAADGAFNAMAYANQTGAAVAYQGQDGRTFTMGFPFECIKDRQQRRSIMQGILQFLLQ